jgi:hypothetical protein
MMNIDSVTAHLSKMSPQQLQQFASMHMDDPIMLAAAKFVSNQQTKMQQSQQPQQGMPPKVNEQTVQSMAPQQQMPQQQAAPQPQAAPQAQGLPEESGIAQLPAQNMQNMAEGGIVAFARGGDAGENSPASYRGYAMQRAQEMGIDPTFADSIFGIESGYKSDAVSPTGPVGVGQLTKKTGEYYGVPASERKDAYKNIDASLAFMADLNKKYQGDPSKMAVAYNQGETVLNKHLRANAGEINPQALPKEAQGYLAKLGKRMTAALPMATAQAAPAPVPGKQPPAGVPADIAQGADNKALVASTGLAALPAAASALRAPSMAVGPATAAAPGGTGRALQTTASRLSPYLRPASMGPAGPVIAGGAALATGAANALSNATPEQLEQLQGDIGSDTGLAAAIMNPANRGPQAPVSPVLAAARKAQAQDNTPSDTVYDPMTGIPMYGTETTTGDDRTFRERLGLGNVANRKANEELERILRLKNLPPTGAGAGRGTVNPRAVMPELEEAPELPKAAQKEVIATAKENVPEGTNTKGFTNEDWLNLGFGLLAGKSQYAMQNLGEAGIATLAAKQARTKTALEARKAEADITQSGAMGKYYESMAAQDKTPAEIKLVEKYASDPKFAAAMDAMAGAKRAPADEAKLKELWSKDLMLQQKYPEVGDFLRMMQSASAGDAVPSVVSGNVAAGQVRAP